MARQTTVNWWRGATRLSQAEEWLRAHRITRITPAVAVTFASAEEAREVARLLTDAQGVLDYRASEAVATQRHRARHSGGAAANRSPRAPHYTAAQVSEASVAVYRAQSAADAFRAQAAPVIAAARALGEATGVGVTR